MKLFNLLIAIYFFILSLAPNMQGAQFLNLTNFIHHYQDHLERNENSNLISFVKEHYFNRLTEFDTDHKHLPLKVNIQVTTGVMNYEKFDIILVTEYLPSIIESSIKNELKRSTFYNKYLHSIWQPPRIS